VLSWTEASNAPVPADLSSNPEPLYFIPFEQVQLGRDAQVELTPRVLRELLAIAGIAAREIRIFQVGLLGHLQESVVCVSELGQRLSA
jgi:hypothetical protein